MKRNFPPPAERLRTLTKRLEAVDRLLTAMRDNITDPPREFTELALRISKGSVEFFRASVTKWAREAAGSNEVLFTELQSANRKAVLAFELSANFLETEQMPLSTGS